MSRLCPRCGAEMKEGAKFCSRCGYEYNHGKICPNCRATIKDDALFCTNCGCKFNTSSKSQTNPLEVIICIALIISSFIIPTIAIPILITLICVILLKKNRKWYKINKITRRVGITITTLVAIIIATSLFSSSGDYDSSINVSNETKVSIDIEEFKKEFCRNIGTDYSSDDWINENGIEMYFNNTGLSIGLITENNILSGISIVQDMYKTGQDYTINENLNLLDEAFEWKCAALSALTGEDIQETSEKLQSYNLENQNIENQKFAENVFIETSTKSNLSIFTIIIK